MTTPQAHCSMLLGVYGVAMSVLQMTLLAMFDWWYIHRWGLASSLFALVACLFCLRRGSRLRNWVAAGFLASSCWFFFSDGTTFGYPHHGRLLVVASAICYCLGAVAGFLIVLRLLHPPKAVLMCASTAFALFMAEVGIGLGLPHYVHEPAMAIGSWKHHDVLGWINRPHSARKDVYPSNPRGYFDEERPLGQLHLREVELRSSNDDRVQLRRTSSDPSVLKVNIVGVEESNGWYMQLGWSGLPVHWGETYRAVFTARARLDRQLQVAFSQGHPPWQPLDSSELFDISPQWKAFAHTFTAATSDKNGRLCIDGSSSATGFEIKELSLQPVSFPLTQVPLRFKVSYELNSSGFRDREFEIPRPDGTFRIACLGDSYTFGVGVHQDDTFCPRLELLLNSASGLHPETISKWEVVNCGVPGFDTRQERLYFEEIARRYEPNLVLITMVSNDDGLEYIGGVCAEFGLVRMLEATTRNADYSGCLEEVLLLDETCRKSGVPLGVVVFRSDVSRPWTQLVTTMRQGLIDKAIPLIDLGESLLVDPSKDLTVHAIDGHPNEVAHGIAAEKIHTWLHSAFQAEDYRDSPRIRVKATATKR